MKPTLTDGTEKRWTVYVGGVEVNDFLLSFDDAVRTAEMYIEDGYDNVVVYQYDTAEEIRF